MRAGRRRAKWAWKVCPSIDWPGPRALVSSGGLAGAWRVGLRSVCVCVGGGDQHLKYVGCVWLFQPMGEVPLSSFVVECGSLTPQIPVCSSGEARGMRRGCLPGR